MGTERRGVAVEVGDGASVLVGPDNGLLAPAVAMVGGATAAVTLDNEDYRLPAPGPTFDGRDVFGPAAAHLCNGVPLTELGTPLDPASLVPGILPVSRFEDGETVLVAEALWVDRFGNVQINVDPDEIAPWGDRLRIEIGERTRTAVRADGYAGIPAGSVGLVVDSYGLVSLAVDRGSAGEQLEVGPGDEVLIRPAEAVVELS